MSRPDQFAQMRRYMGQALAGCSLADIERLVARCEATVHSRDWRQLRAAIEAEDRAMARQHRLLGGTNDEEAR